MNKAQRGALEIHLPIGFEWCEGQIKKIPDESVRTTLSTLFSLFQQIGSIRGVLLELRRRQQEIPYERVGGKERRIAWKKASYEAS